MKIKKRLIISNSLIILIPIITTGITIIAFVFFYSRFGAVKFGYNNFKEAVAKKSEIITIIKDVSKTKLNTLDNSTFKIYIEKKLSSINSQAIILKNNNIIFSSKGLTQIDIENSVQYSNGYQKNPVQIGNIYYIPESFSIEFTDGTKGRIIFLNQTTDTHSILKYFFIIILSVFLISYIAANIILSHIFSKKILLPITHLSKASDNIKNGDLNFEIFTEGDDELRKLCCDFEEMRIKLKDSVNLKLKYENNRKMLISSISHDLRTPITSIQGYVQGILDGVANTPEKLNHYLNTISNKSKKVDFMIDNLLLYSKLDMNQIPFKFEKTDIVEYFNYYIEETKIDLKNHGIRLDFKNYIQSPSYVMIDRERFMHVIFNIVGNSIKYMDKEKGLISILLNGLAKSITIKITDNGPGISSNDIKKIFYRFYRSDYARNSAGGSGLGLAIAKQIVEGHGGTIWASSRQFIGTSIIISLPRGGLS